MTDKTIYAATTFHGWGIGVSEYNAIRNISPHERPDPDDTVKLAVFKVKGFDGICPFEVRADEVMDRSYFEIPGDLWNAMRSASLQAESATEGMMSSADEVDEL